MSERELFEAAIKKLGKTDLYTFDKHEDGSYKFDMIHFGWKIWQASANRKGYKLVPVDDLHSIHNELAEEHPNYHLVFSILQRHLDPVGN